MSSRRCANCCSRCGWPSSGFEFKRVEFAGESDGVRAPHRDALADELAAFANAGGGTVVLGVADRAQADGGREVTGIPRERLDALKAGSSIWRRTASPRRSTCAR
ncbi:helix-turn-helix domain-containing protein [Plasticicumulans sp.]|uniref:AlbA family DNA-binding domain-containing protein n=1 Tax=Plasticicumulans sp. TaxID=2307179 RepID=UPI00394B3C43